MENSNLSFCLQNDSAGSSAAGLWTRFFIFVRARGAKSKVPPIAMGGQRLCLWNLPPFEKGGRKLFSFVQVFFQKRFFDTLRDGFRKAESLRDGAACRAVPAVPGSVCRRVEKRTSPKGGILPRRRSLSRRSGGSGKRVPPRRKKNVPERRNPSETAQPVAPFRRFRKACAAASSLMGLGVVMADLGALDFAA